MGSEPRRYQVSLKPSAERELAGLPKKDQKKVARKIQELARNPRPHRVEKIQGGEDLYRVRAGDYRIIYQVEDKVLVVLVVTIGHRGDVYRVLKR